MENGNAIILELNKLFSILKSQALITERAELNTNSIKGLDEEKMNFLSELFLHQRKRLEDTQKVEIANEVPILSHFSWRLEVEVANRERKQSFIPNYLLNFRFSEIVKGENTLSENQDLCVGCDHGTLKKVGMDFKNMKGFPNSITYRKMMRGVHNKIEKMMM